LFSASKAKHTVSNVPPCRPDLSQTGAWGAIFFPSTASRAYPLLHDIECRDWRMLFEAMRIEASVPETGTAYADDHLLVRAAAAGQGLALVSTAYANSEIDSGRVVSPLSVRWLTKFAYYLVGRPQTFRRSTVRQCKTWILAEAAPNNNR
jgi:LysR family glycine cleavage system transcriptional activator